MQTATEQYSRLHFDFKNLGNFVITILSHRIILATKYIILQFGTVWKINYVFPSSFQAR